MKTSDLVKMAKSKKTISKPNSTVKKEPKKTVEVKNIAPEVEEDRDTKAKNAVDKLLEGLSLNPFDYKKKEVVNVEENDDSEDLHENSNSGDWLEQQVTELTEVNEYLRTQLANIAPHKINKTNYNDSEVILEDTNANVKVNVVKLFMELQTAYMNVGFNYNTGIPVSNLVIYPEAFMSRLINFFPFLEDYRKIQLP